jgi:hypothetical protein
MNPDQVRRRFSAKEAHGGPVRRCRRSAKVKVTIQVARSIGSAPAYRLAFGDKNEEQTEGPRVNPPIWRVAKKHQESGIPLSVKIPTAFRPQYPGSISFQIGRGEAYAFVIQAF